MKRQVIAVALGSLIALPAFANYEIDAGYSAPMAVSAKSRAEVRAELVEAQRAGDLIVNGELGITARQVARMQQVGKTREQVRAETVLAIRSGDIVVDAELGTTASRL